MGSGSDENVSKMTGMCVACAERAPRAHGIPWPLIGKFLPKARISSSYGSSNTIVPQRIWQGSESVLLPSL